MTIRYELLLLQRFADFPRLPRQFAEPVVAPVMHDKKDRIHFCDIDNTVSKATVVTVSLNDLADK
jgi:hypothetical protein